MLILAGVVVAILLIIIWIYNTLIVKKNQVENVFSTVDVMLKKRYDLIPNLVETVKGYVKHERETLETITQLRAKAVSGTISNDQKIELGDAITKLLPAIFAVAENYPDLKASTNFLNLQRNLTELEEQISAARRAFNAAVNDYNNAVEMFPTNIAASMMGYKRKNFFEIPEIQKQVPVAKVQ